MLLLPSRTDASAAHAFHKLVAPQGLSVDFSSEIADGLVLCPSDIDPTNFMINEKGEVFAIDFGCTGYMPPSYISYSFAQPKPFARVVAACIQYPESANLLAMECAVYYIVVTSNNSLGMRSRLILVPVRH